MSSFSEISAALEKVLSDVSEKKEILEKASESVRVASQEYEKAVGNAQALRAQLSDELAKLLPVQHPNRVRMSA
jgi:endonuclease V-like protein UPF0215 family